MIKINEIKLLAMINKGDLDVLKKHIENEIVLQSKPLTAKKQIKSFESLAKKYSKEVDKKYVTQEGACYREGDHICITNTYVVVDMFDPERVVSVEKENADCTRKIRRIVKEMTDDIHTRIKFNISSEEVLRKETEFATFVRQENLTKKDCLKHLNSPAYFHYKNISDSGELIEFKLNLQYLTDVRKCIDLDKATFYYGGSTTPILIKEGENTAIICPVRLNS